MTSVNSPATVLARNHFYRNSSPSPEPLKSTFSGQNDYVIQREKNSCQWITMATPPGLPVLLGSKGLWIHVVVRRSFSMHLPTFKTSFSAEQPVKQAYISIRLKTS
ncbi:hypothetical protein FQA47_012318 [Oryzias melastigma]|uniref:Uncharacterized protein n=1 Tax=Oryzias melastigma TaxID=30732 RepID=A0A834CM54_ORYME|nr:hypothetical protein FQA47_012318 [Oryzias melastigma]